MNTPTTLIILDGFGCREPREDNAIAAAKKPTLDHLLATYPHTQISGSGHCVGLPDGQMGNSEVGHLNIGAGRIVQQDLTRVDSAIASGDFYQNPTLTQAVQLAKKNQRAVHVMGLLSPGGVHSHETHLFAMADFCAKQNQHKLYFHPFLDGRDTPPKSAAASLAALEAHCQTVGVGRIASLIGRYYAMDRDHRWERIQAAYNLLTQGTAVATADTAVAGLEAAYARGETDEFVQATSIHPPEEGPVTIQDGDVVIFMNFRSDRARELTLAFTAPDFTGFQRQARPHLAEFVCLTQYDATFNLPIVFPPQPLTDLLGEVISRAGMKQLRIAETEKYAHVTFFFNGGVEAPLPLEDRLLIPSPKVATYDLQPEMSAPALTEKLVAAILSKQYDFIVCNFANADMVGHSGNFAATVKAIETLDTCLGKIIAALSAVGGEAIITADHGNAEQMFDPLTQQAHTAHTSDPVPFIYVGRKANIVGENGKLSDIAPTVLTLFNLPIPPSMTGRSLIKLG
jgi:2,3-bisphosphoglycerate-independent phosphoglycerate mutase